MARKTRGPCTVAGYVLTLPWVRFRVRVELGFGLASREGWVGTWPATAFVGSSLVAGHVLTHPSLEANPNPNPNSKPKPRGWVWGWGGGGGGGGGVEVETWPATVQGILPLWQEKEKSRLYAELGLSKHRGNTSMTSLPLVSVRASSILLVHNLCCDNCI